MATTLQPIKPFTLRDVVMDIATPGAPTTSYDFAKALEAVRFTPAQQMVTWSGLHPDATATETTPETWTATLTYAQDWESTNSLSRFLFDHAGKTTTAKFRPKRSGPGTEWTATLVLVAGEIGGQAGQFATASVTCGVTGRPSPAAVTS